MKRSGRNTSAANALNQYIHALSNESPPIAQGLHYDDDGNLIEGYVAADMDCNGVLNSFDLDPFVLAVMNPAGYEAAYPDCNILNADVNGDGSVNTFDIDTFSDILGGHGGAGAMFARRYEYDAENRLIAVTPGGTLQAGDVKVEFAYDHMGRRIRKVVSEWTAGAWAVQSERKFVWSGWLLLMELDGNNAVVRSYTWGLDLAGQAGLVNSLEDAGGIGGLLAVQDAGLSEDYVYLYDANGNVGQMIAWAQGYGGTIDYEWDTTPAGNVRLVAHYEYDPYGNVVAQSGTYADENPFRFSTKYWDDETGLGYWGYRYYSPRLGRWVSRDPIAEKGGLNLYQYARNQPPSIIDSLGRQATISDGWKPSCLCWISRTDREEIQSRVREYAEHQLSQVKAGTSTSCEAMAEVYGFATRYYRCKLTGFQKDAYIRDVTRILSGVTSWGNGTDGTHVRGFDDSGFKEEFQDGSNQVQHFSAGLYNGWIYGFAARAGHRLMRPDDPEDTALNDWSTSQAVTLHRRWDREFLTMREWILVNICDPNTEASSKVDPEQREELNED